LKVNSRSNELLVRRSPAAKDVSTEAEDFVEIRHQATTCEGVADCEDLVCPIVIFEVCRAVRA
jgi:hypothetical protein